MKKKNILVMLISFIMSVVLIGCTTSTNSIESIELIEGVKTTFNVNESLNLDGVKLQVYYTDGKEQMISGTTTGVAIKGFDTSTATTEAKRLTITYRTVSLSLYYNVVDGISDSSKAVDDVALSIKLAAGITPIYLTGTSYKTNHIITRNVTLIGVETENKKPVFEGTIKVAPTSPERITVLIENLEISATKTDAINASSLRASTAEGFDKLTIRNCGITSNINPGTGTTNLVNIESSPQLEFVFNNNNVKDGSDAYKIGYLVRFNSIKRLAPATFENNIIKCKFDYGFYFIEYATFNGNYIESTDDVESINDVKNPVIFHTHPNATDKGYRLNIQNNTFVHAESLFRFYLADFILSVESLKSSVIFKNNQINDVLSIATDSTASHVYDLYSVLMDESSHNVMYNCGYNGLYSRSLLVNNIPLILEGTGDKYILRDHANKLVVYYKSGYKKFVYTHNVEIDDIIDVTSGKNMNGEYTYVAHYALGGKGKTDIFVKDGLYYYITASASTIKDTVGVAAGMYKSGLIKLVGTSGAYSQLPQTVRDIFPELLVS